MAEFSILFYSRSKKIFGGLMLILFYSRFNGKFDGLISIPF